MTELKVTLKEFEFNEFTYKKLLNNDNGHFGSTEFGSEFVAKYPGYEWVTVKEISHDIHTNKRKLQRGANTLIQLNGDYIVNFFGVVLEPRNTCLVIEYMAFSTVHNYMSELPKQYFDWPLRLRILNQVAKALNFLHSRQVFHQSLDASVVMLDSHVNAKLAECGFRQLTMRSWMETAQTYQQSQRLNRAQSNVSFYAPEQINDINTEASTCTDMYAFGILTWHIMTKKMPFDGMSNEEVFKKVGQRKHPGDIPKSDEIPQVLVDIVKRCWDFDPRQRLSGSEVIEMLKLNHAQEIEAKNIAHAALQVYRDYCLKIGLPLPPEGNKYRGIKKRISENHKPVLHPSGEFSIVPDTQDTQPKAMAQGNVVSGQVQGEPDKSLNADPFLEMAADQQSTVDTSSSSATDSREASRFGSSEYLDETTYPLTTQPCTTTTTSPSMITTPSFYSTNSPSQSPVTVMTDSQSSQSIPAEGSPAPVTPHHLYQIAQHMGKRWRRFGELILHFSEGELDAFEYGQNDLRDIIYKMLANWVDSHGGKHVVSVGRLISKLKEGCLIDVASRVDA